jgi:hypothetical protein
MNLVIYDEATLAQFPALLGELEQLVARINLVFGQEHDPQTGAHTEITVDAVTWTGDTQTTVGAAGGASALPATPTAYIPIVIGTSTYVMPIYDAS